MDAGASLVTWTQTPLVDHFVKHDTAAATANDTHGCGRPVGAKLKFNQRGRFNYVWLLVDNLGRKAEH